MKDELVGRQFGNYLLRRLLGRGSFADVYLGEHLYLKTQAAIKILRLHLIDETCASFLQEAQTVAHLEHPHIIRVLEFGVEQERPFLVMHYAPHGTLRQRFRRGIELSPIAIVPYLKQIAAALDYAHSRNVIHRDVKPDNILLLSESELVLSDFGLATLTHSFSWEGTSSDQVGTLPYMAPEQIQGQVSAASDQYALGIMVYEWLTGHAPFLGTQFEIMVQHMSATPALMNVDIDEEVEEVVFRALSKNPSERFSSTVDFASAFERAVGTLPASLSTTLPMLAVNSSQKDTQPSSPAQEQGRYSHIASMPTRVTGAIAPLSASQAENSIQKSSSSQEMHPYTRRRALLGIVGVLSAGALGTGLVAWFAHSPRSSSLTSVRQTQGTFSSTSLIGAPSPDVNKTPSPSVGQGGTSDQTPTPGSAGSVATPSPTATSNPSLSLQLNYYPDTLVNGQMATLDVTANEPDVQVLLNVSYNVSSGKPVSVTQQVDSQGHANLAWLVKISSGKKSSQLQATLLLSAHDANGQSTSAPPLSLPVIQ